MGVLPRCVFLVDYITNYKIPTSFGVLGGDTD